MRNGGYQNKNIKHMIQHKTYDKHKMYDNHKTYDKHKTYDNRKRYIHLNHETIKQTKEGKESDNTRIRIIWMKSQGIYNNGNKAK